MIGIKVLIWGLNLIVIKRVLFIYYYYYYYFFFYDGFGDLVRKLVEVFAG